jgi:hypothetical protein
MSEGIKVEVNDSQKKKVNLKGIERVNNIKVVRQKEPSISSESSYTDSSYSESEDSMSIASSEPVKRKKKVKVLQKKQRPVYEPNPKDYNAFLNPKKVKARESDDDLESEYSEITESEYSDDSEFVKPTERSEKQNWEDQQKLKQELLIKIQALEKKGFEFSKKFNMTSNFDEMTFEFEKVKKYIDSQAAIKFSRRCLMACVTGLEFLNKKFDPFAIKLEGWSENVMESIDDYDNIFEKLHEKYSSKAEIAPEIELLLTLGGSAFMFHLTNSLLKGPTMGNIAQNNNPNFMASMMKSMSEGLKEAGKPPNFKAPGQGFQQQTPGPGGMPKPMETRGGRKEMRGPSMDPGLFSGTPLATNHPNQVNAFPQPPLPNQFAPGPMNMSMNDIRKYYEETLNDEEDRFSIASSDSSLSSVSVKNVRVVGKGKGKGGLELNIK